MNKILHIAISLLAACLLLAAGPAHAAKMPKVDICHFDADEGIYKKSAVSGNAMQSHLDHGDVIPGVDNEPPLPDLDDDCFAIIVPDPLARAYIDVDQDGAYDANTDVDIAVLLDSDGTPGLSVGDTLELGQYPKDFDPCPDLTTCPNLGNFNNVSHQVTVLGSPSRCCGYSAQVGPIGALWEFAIVRNDVEETLQFQTQSSADRVIILDLLTVDGGDRVGVDAAPADWSASEQVPIAFAPPRSSDDPFINVIIY